MGDKNVTAVIQEYENFTAVSVDLSSSEDYTLKTMGEGLAKLSSYVLGYNEDDQVSEMTAPFIMEGSKMFIRQPGNMYGCQPKDSSIQIEECTGETYAMLEFPGICTNAEI